MAYSTIVATFEGKAYSASTGISDAVKNALMRDITSGVQEVALELKGALDKLYDDLAAKHGTLWPQGTTPTTLSVRSGMGLRSIKDSINVGTSADGTITGVISTGRMTVHETGATIHPTRAQYLTVPLAPALNQRGLPLRVNARAWDNTFIATSRRGNLLIFQKNTGGTITPLYLLKKEVKIRPRLGMSEMFDQMIPYFEQKAIEALERKLG